jgi:hypothetical protein
VLDAVGPLQRLDLARDLEQMALERGEIRPRLRGGSKRRGRRGAARRHRPRRGFVELVLARGDFRDRKIERGQVQRRRRAIDLRRRAIDRLGAALRILELDLFRRLVICDSRAFKREVASSSCGATPGSSPETSVRAASWPGAGSVRSSIWRVIESSR